MKPEPVKIKGLAMMKYMKCEFSESYPSREGFEVEIETMNMSPMMPPFFGQDASSDCIFGVHQR